jgi:hypothetical protein
MRRLPLRLAGLCRLRSLRRLRSRVVLVQGWLPRLLDRGAYGDVNRPGRLDPLGQRQCGKLGLGSGARLRRFSLPVMSVDPIKKCWRENRSTPAPGPDEIPNNTITIIAATPHYAGRGNVNGPAPRPGIHKPG